MVDWGRLLSGCRAYTPTAGSNPVLPAAKKTVFVTVFFVKRLCHAVTRLREIETIQVHDLVPGSDEIVHKHLLRIIRPINLGNCAQLGV